MNLNEYEPIKGEKWNTYQIQCLFSVSQLPPHFFLSKQYSTIYQV